MTASTIQVVRPDTTVDEALELLVKFRISGLPVVDDERRVVGVVSDYDLLNLDGILEAQERAREKDLFPAAGESWGAFKDIKLLLAKTGKKLVKDVMTPKPICVTPDMSLDEAARLLLLKRIHRLPVIDSDGKIVGVLSRGNIVKAVLAAHQQSKIKLAGTSTNGSQGLTNGAQ